MRALLSEQVFLLLRQVMHALSRETDEELPSLAGQVGVARWRAVVQWRGWSGGAVMRCSDGNLLTSC
jgi:hypothetical protein